MWLEIWISLLVLTFNNGFFYLIVFISKPINTFFHCEVYTAWNEFYFGHADKTYFGNVVLFPKLELFLFPSQVNDKNNRKNKRRNLWTQNFVILKGSIPMKTAKLYFSVMLLVAQYFGLRWLTPVPWNCTLIWYNDTVKIGRSHDTISSSLT